MINSAKIVERLRKEAHALGFDHLGITAAKHPKGTAENLRHFVESGYHGSMGWMAETLERRSDPKVLWEEARSVIVLAMNYGPEQDPMGNLANRQNGNISVYARNRDYHDVIKGRLKTLANKLGAMVRHQAAQFDAKVFVDTAPVMEKPLAQSAGLGWQGKHTNLVSREIGSWFFLGSIFTNLDLAAEAGATAETDHCGSCRNCLDVCPTQAFPAPYKLDARRCISYLTIEYDGPIPAEFRSAMGNRIYGCDDCLAVCPWNKFAKVASEQKLATPQEPRSTDLADLLGLDDARFRQRFSGSPVKRIGRDRFIRNCLIAAGNSRSAALMPHVQAHLNGPSSVLRETAEWALQQLEGSTP